MNWKEEVIKLIEEYYRSFEITYKSSSDVHRCIIDFLTLTELKLIKPATRQVFISDKIKTRDIPAENAKALITIEKKVKAGESLTFHQSKRALKPHTNDQLLNDWLIYHLHLSDWKKKSTDKFFDRTKLVLFAIFNPTQAFFIDVRPHGKEGEKNVFAKKELLEIVDNNWPSMLKEYITEDVIMLSHSVTDEERAKAREVHLSLGLTEVNGKMIINPGVGVTSSGHNLLIVKKANEVIRFVQESLMEIDKDEEAMKVALSKETGFEIKELDVCIHRLAKWPFFAVYENNSQCYIQKTYE